MIWESDEPGQGRSVTFREMSHQVSRIANFMKSKGVRKGEVVTVYMPMIPELPMVLLACTRIGAVHSVVFAGFSATSLRDRVVDCNSRWVFTSDQGLRGGKAIPLKDITDKVCYPLPLLCIITSPFLIIHTLRYSRLSKVFLLCRMSLCSNGQTWTCP